MNDKKNNSIRYFSVSTFLLTGKQMVLAMMLACSPLAMSAQKISLGSCITRDGGQYKGEMVSGKPQGKGSTVYKNGDTYEGAYVKRGKSCGSWAREGLSRDSISEMSHFLPDTLDGIV